jgi:hypothetical protein
MFKLFVFAPDKEEVVNSIISSASKAGAGVIGNYSCCAFVTKGMGNWKSEEGAHPTIGKVGEMSHEPEVRIEMVCPKDKAVAVKKAIKSVHPYEEPEIDFVELVTVD